MSKLPLKRAILQRYRALKSKCLTAQQNVLADTITKELIELI